MTSEREALVGELHELRKGYGLTPERLVECPHLLAALGNGLSLQQAYDKLVRLVRELGEQEPAQVLRRAFAIEGRSEGVLSKRRTVYQEVTGRDIKTIIRYENRMIEDLATRLLANKGSDHVWVAAFFENRRLDFAKVDYDRNAPGLRGDVEREFKNQAPGPSLPFWLYKLPPGYSPARMSIVVRIRDEQPQEVWSIVTPDIFAINAEKSTHRVYHWPGDDLVKDAYLLEIDYPSPEMYYGVGWLYETP